MKIFLIPPKIDTNVIKEGISKLDKIFLADPFTQKDLYSEFAKNLVVPEEIDSDDADRIVEDNYKVLSRGWFRLKEAKEILTFKEVNIAEYFFIEFNFYIFKILRYLSHARNIINSFNSYEIVLFDDGGEWARIFKMVAGKNGHSISLKKYEKREKQKISSSSYAKGLFRKIIVKTYKRVQPVYERGGILFSCAYRFAEPLWAQSNKKNKGYFIRPDLSPKIERNITKLKDIYNIHNDFFVNNTDLNSVKMWIKNNDYKTNLDRIFKSNEFFVVAGINLWLAIQKELMNMIDKYIGESARLVVGMRRMFSELSPRIVIVDEDLCPFNKMLVNCAHSAGIQVVQIIHGLMTFDVFTGEMSSDEYLVQGEYSRQFLIEAGIDREKIHPIGAPQYSYYTSRLDKEETRSKFMKKFSIKKDRRFVLLATQPFFTERDPYFSGHPLTYENVKRMLNIAIRAVSYDNERILIVKTHPMDRRTDHLKKIISRSADYKQVLLVDDYSTIELSSISDLVLCSGSTVYTEALLSKTPVMLFDSEKEKKWSKLRSEYLYMEDENACVNRIREILEDKVSRTERMNCQEEELSWHFDDKNKSAIQKFNRFMAEMTGEIL